MDERKRGRLLGSCDVGFSEDQWPVAHHPRARVDACQDVGLNTRSASRTCEETGEGFRPTGPLRDALGYHRARPLLSWILMNNEQRAAQVLRDVFGYSAFRGEQEQVVDHLVRG